MRLGNIIDELLNQYRLPNTSTTEETNLATTGIGSKEVHHFDTSLKYFGCR
jgi:hypothetical protein